MITKQKTTVTHDVLRGRVTRLRCEEIEYTEADSQTSSITVTIPIEHPRNWSELCRTYSICGISALSECLVDSSLMRVPLLFTVNSCWQPDSAVVSRKGLWAEPVRRNVIESGGEIVAEYSIKRNQKVRFFGTIKLTPESLPLACDLVRGDSASFIVFLKAMPSDLIGTIQMLMNSAFPDCSSDKPLAVDWIRLVKSVNAFGGVSLLVDGNFDDTDLVYEIYLVRKNVASQTKS